MRAIPPILAAFTALAVVSAEAATNRIQKFGIRSAPPCLLGRATTAAAKAGAKLCGATGTAIGGWAPACRTDDLAPYGRRLTGMRG